ncbi:M57 family metalloprotease [Subtercola sp. YIM 133946]|uniref:M57 family metalloprotease n=1 Tax=Subtercola sp. YIM 133946 TaxID=3118909 RepID=UPI002F94FC8F
MARVRARTTAVCSIVVALAAAALVVSGSMSAQAAALSAAAPVPAVPSPDGDDAPLLTDQPAPAAGDPVTLRPDQQPHSIPADPAGTNPNFVALSSKPDSTKTIWLNFDGGTLTNTWWNFERPDHTNAPIVYSGAAIDDSVARRTEIFERVAEIYAPFDVDVTTVYPGDDALNRSGPDDQRYGVTDILTDTTADQMGINLASGHPGGGIYDSFGNPYENQTFVVASELEGYVKDIATDMAHEVGHSLGLAHSGWHDGAGAYDEYYTPYGGLWAPEMGNPAWVPLARWSDNAYVGATHPAQDDLAVITDQAEAKVIQGSTYAVGSGDLMPSDRAECQEDGVYWAPDSLDADGYAICGDYDPSKRLSSITYYSGKLDFRADDVGDTAATATPLVLANDAGSASGIISTNSDTDVYALTMPAGTLSLHATPAAIGANLDISLTVTDSTGAVVAVVDLPDSVGGVFPEVTLVGADAQTTLALPQGTYDVSIEGTGFGDMATNTEFGTPAAPKYGSLGQYTLAAAVTPDPVVPTPAPTPTPTSTPVVPVVPDASGGSSSLAATGTAPLWPIGLLGAVVLLAGGLIFAGVRRRS